MKILITVIILSVFPVFELHGQESDPAITVGHEVTIESSVLDEARELWVATPQGYAASGESYPVLYVLDGENHFQHATSSARFLASAGRIPGLIVVGILNTDRGRDLTPHSEDPDDLASVPTLGGADAFQDFLERELFAYVDSHYNTRPYRVVVGHSLGGLFALHTLTSRSDLFDAYIAISPSLQWSDQGMVQQSEEFFRATSQLSADLYMAAANEGGEMLGALRKLTGIIGDATPQRFRWAFTHMPEEHHGSVALRSTYDGLESVFDGWSLENALELYDTGGLAAVRNHYRAGGSRFGYERTLPATSILQIASRLIQQNRLDEAATLVMEDFGSPPPSYFVNLIADRYSEEGQAGRAQELYEASLSFNPSDEVARARLTAMGVDVSALLPEISISEATLETYAGDYQIQEDVTATIYLEDGTLFFQASRQRAGELVPVSDSRFVVSGSDLQIEFRAEPGAAAHEMILMQFGQQREALRIE